MSQKKIKDSLNELNSRQRKALNDYYSALYSGDEQKAEAAAAELPEDVREYAEMCYILNTNAGIRRLMEWSRTADPAAVRAVTKWMIKRTEQHKNEGAVS